MDKNFSDKSISKAIKNKDTDTLIAALSEDEKKLLNTLLKDESKRREFLSSEKAQSIISNLFKDR